MLRELVGKLALASIVLLLFLSACIEYEQVEFYKQKCLSLATYDVAQIPSCNTNEKCFELVESKLFNFPSQSLPFESKRLLYHYKNHLAKSWLYYRKTIEDAKELRELCLQERFRELPKKANELRYHVEKAFEEADNALQTSFKFIIFEKMDLENQDINLMKEEPLYRVYIKLSDNVRQIRSNKLLELNSYASHARRLAEKISRRKAFRNADLKIIEEKSLFEMMLDVAANFELEGIGKSSYLPVFANLVSYYASILSSIKTAERALSYIEETPPSEFLSLLSDIAASQDSLASEFASLVKEDSLKRMFLKEELSKLQNSLEGKLNKLREQASFFENEGFRYADSNFITSLHALLNEPLLISNEPLAFDSLADAHLRAESMLASLSAKLDEIRSKESKHALTLGKKVHALKNLNLEADELLRSLASLRESFYYLLDKCNKRLSNANIKAYDASTTFELEMLREKFKQANESLKLAYCASFVKVELEAKERLARKEGNKAKLLESNCYKRLSMLINFVKDPELAEQYSMLSSSSEPLKSCPLLLSFVEEHLRGEYGIEELEERYVEIKKLWSFLKEQGYVEDKEIANLGGFFFANKILLEKAMPYINSLRYKINTLYSKTKEKVKEFVVSYVKEHYSLVAAPTELAVLSHKKPKTVLESRFVLSFTNPFLDIDNSIVLTFPEGLSRCKLISASANVEALECEAKTLRLFLKSLPKGKTLASFSSPQNIELKREKVNVTMSSNIARISEAYKIKSNATIPKLKLEFPNIGHRAILFYRGLAIELKTDNNAIVAFLTDVEPNSTFEVSYTIYAPVRISLKILSEERDSNTAKILYLCSIENKIPFSARNVMLFLPLETSNIIEANAYDALGKTIKLKKSKSHLVAILPSLDKLEKKEIYLQLIIEDYNSFRQALIAKTKYILKGLLDSKEFAPKAKELLLKARHASNAKLSEVQKLYEQALLLKNEEKEHASITERYLFAKQSLEGKLNELNNKLEKAKELGLIKYFTYLEQNITHAKKELAEAEKLFSEDRKKALQILEKAYNKLLYIQAKDVAEKLAELADDLMKRTSDLEKKATETGLRDSNIEIAIEDIKATYERLLNYIGKAKLPEAKQALNSMEKRLEDLNRSLNLKIQSRVAYLLKAIDFINQFSTSFYSRLNFLEKQLSSVTNDELLGANYIPKFDQHMLKNLVKEAELAGDPIWEKVNQLIKQNMLEKAIAIAKEENFDKKYRKLLHLDRKLAELETSLKEEALYYTKLLEDAHANSELLKLAKKELLAGNYLKALVVAKSGLATLSEEDSVTLYLIAFLTILVIIAILRMKSGKKEEPRTLKVLKACQR